MLFQRFDRLLFLAKGGKTVYFGEVGDNSRTLLDYFERNGGFPCPKEANPAEYMLEVIGAAPGSHTDIDWHETWNNSAEYQAVQDELDHMKNERAGLSKVQTRSKDKASYREFAAPFLTQYLEVQKRVFQQYFRTPSYIYAKLSLVTLVGLFIGFSFFKAQNTQQGLQNQLFGLFMLFTVFGQLVQQIMPLFVTQRALYEVRERPSKTYSWKAFMLSNIIAELPYNFVASVLLFFCWYYSIGLYNNAVPTDTVHERGAQMWLFILVFLLFSSTFAHMVIAAIETAETGGNIANLMFSLSLVFCGVLAGPSVFPGFWIWMYRISPFTYLVEGMLATAVKDAAVICLDVDFQRMPPPSGESCQTFLTPYVNSLGGYIGSGSNATTCELCQLSTTNAFLEAVTINPNNGWRDFGIMWAYIIFNVFAALFLYWAIRMPHGKKEKSDKKDNKKEKPITQPSSEKEIVEKKATNDSGSSGPVNHITKADLAEQGFEPIKAPAEKRPIEEV